MQRVTGQVEYTHEPQNVHFHSMYQARYPNFPGASALIVPSELYTSHFCLEHTQRLTAEFG